jgi:hypothetical protein
MRSADVAADGGQPPVDAVDDTPPLAQAGVVEQDQQHEGIYEEEQPEPTTVEHGDVRRRGGLKKVLFEKDYKYTEQDVSSEDDLAEVRPRRVSKSLGRSKTLPKIEYSKLVTLSLNNFAEYRESIKALAYTRGWLDKYRMPSLQDLQDQWDGVDGWTVDHEIRREAFLVLYQTIPKGLKYLVDNVVSGDVIALWKVLYERFLFVTAASVKKLKKEWESLEQGSSQIDEFISVVSTKAKSMEMMGVPISDQDKASALIHGLSKDYDWLKNYYATRDTYSFVEVATESLKFAVDRQWLANAKKEVPKNDHAGSERSVCIGFNSPGGCNRTKCSFKHELVSAKKLEKLKAKVKEQKEARSGRASKTSNSKQSVLVTQSSSQSSSQKVVSCWMCGEKGHVVSNCPLKAKIDDFIGKLKSSESGSKIGVVEGGNKLTLTILLSNVSSNSNEWILDSGAAYHITNSPLGILDASPVEESVVFTVGNSNFMRPSSKGSKVLGDIRVRNVFVCEECPVNILSESCLLSQGVDIENKSSSKVATVSYGGQPIMLAELRRGLFVVTQALEVGGVLVKLCQ